ncbi:hypothetical protein EXIGLDRAFT_699474 [Exidia glandulosa HHB12029]|uniref:Uncharacterized protein n=1 Tax=Exidia glandulosa HHB12029 TaxID=1314781 RepID=A0A165DVF1_EXIGL|nr:hypothetical protein EXIGLDRAFT_699474 [Exidia glandulosa HHB12029]
MAPCARSSYMAPGPVWADSTRVRASTRVTKPEGPVFGPSRNGNARSARTRAPAPSPAPLGDARDRLAWRQRAGATAGASLCGAAHTPPSWRVVLGQYGGLGVLLVPAPNLVRLYITWKRACLTQTQDEHRANTADALHELERHISLWAYTLPHASHLATRCATGLGLSANNPQSHSGPSSVASRALAAKGGERKITVSDLADVLLEDDINELTKKKGSRPPSKSPVPPDSKWVDEEDIAATGPREDDVVSHKSTGATLTAEANSTSNDGAVDQAMDHTPEPVQEGRLRRSNRTTTAPESYATQRSASSKAGAAVIKPKSQSTKPAAAVKPATNVTQSERGSSVLDEARGLESIAANEEAEFTALTRRALPKNSASAKSSTTASMATAKPSANTKSTKRPDNSLRGNLPRDKDDAIESMEEIPDNPEAAIPSLILSQRPSRAASKVANERLPAILESGSDSGEDAFEPHIGVDESDYDELGSVDSGDEDEEDDEDSHGFPEVEEAGCRACTGDGATKGSGADHVYVHLRVVSAAADTEPTDMLKVPRKGQTEKKTLEVEKDLHWTAFRAHVLLAMCLVTTQEEASAYPATQAPMSYRLGARGTFSTLVDHTDYKAMLSNIEARQKRPLVQVELQCLEVESSSAGAKGKAKKGNDDAVPLLGHGPHRKYVEALYAEYGACADPTCNIQHCKLDFEGNHREVTEGMFIDWGLHLVGSAPQLGAATRPGTRTAKQAPSDSAVEMMKEFTQLARAIIPTPGLAGPPAPIAAPPAIEAAYDNRIYPTIEESLVSLTESERDRNLPKARDYSGYLRAFEDDIGWRFISDVYDGCRTFEAFRIEFADELKGIQRGPLEVMWKWFAAEVKRVQAEQAVSKNTESSIVFWGVRRKVDKPNTSGMAFADAINVMDAAVVDDQDAVLLRPGVHLLKYSIDEVDELGSVERAADDRAMKNTFERKRG